VKKWKLALVVCGVAGLLASLVPFSGHSLLLDEFALDRRAALVHAAIFVLPLAMGAIGLARPPMPVWQSGVALAACVLGVVRFQLWHLALHLPSVGARGAVLTFALVLGTVASVVTLLRPEA
jgi:hypothetical protein